jgi:tetratricopeptide (TPR) repeat protein
MKLTILAAALLAAGAVGLFAQPTTAKPAQAAPAQAPKGPTVKSQAELQALQAWQAALQAGDPDGIIKADDDVLIKFPATDFKANVLETEATAYKQKGDWIKAQIYASQALAANPQSFQSALMLADIPAKHTGEHDLDKEESLTKAEKYAHQAIDIVNAAPKPQQLTDQQWTEYQKQIASQAQDDLGLISMDRKSWDAAVASFKAAFALVAEPAYKVHLANALTFGGKYDDAIAVCDQILAEPNLHPQIQSAAKSVRANATAAKAMAK